MVLMYALNQLVRICQFYGGGAGPPINYLEAVNEIGLLCKDHSIPIVGLGNWLRWSMNKSNQAQEQLVTDAELDLAGEIEKFTFDQGSAWSACEKVSNFIKF